MSEKKLKVTVEEVTTSQPSSNRPGRRDWIGLALVAMTFVMLVIALRQGF